MEKRIVLVNESSCEKEEITLEITEQVTKSVRKVKNKCRFIDENQIRCVKEATYGHKHGKRLFCKNHKEANMICICGKLCSNPECGKGGKYHLPNDSKAYCKTHAPLEAKDTESKKCLKCDKRPNFNFPTETIPKFCKTHMEVGMVSVTKVICSAEGCNISPIYGFPNGRPERCSTHKLDNMINVIKNTCLECPNTALFNFIGQKRNLL